MRKLSMIAMMGAILSAPAALAQTSPPAVSSAPAATSSPTPSVQAAGKREACRTNAETNAARGQAKRDAMQLCMAQGQLDCVKEAIAQRTAGQQRKDFMKTCMGPKAGPKSPI